MIGCTVSTTPGFVVVDPDGVSATDALAAAPVGALSWNVGSTQ